MRKWRQLLIVVFGGMMILIHVNPAGADTGEIAFGVKAGTLGLGAEMTIGLLPHLNARLGLNGFTYDYDEKISDIDYDFDFNLLSAALLVDYHLLKSAFRLSAGLVLNQNELDLVAGTDDDFFIINDVAYSTEDVGDLTGTVDFNAISPYLGIGWGDAVGEDSRLSFFIDLGILFQGSPQAELDATGPIASDPQFRRDLNSEEKEIEDETEQFTVYPVITIGITYKF